MNEEEQQIAIAEACGWEFKTSSSPYGDITHAVKPGCGPNNVPDYLHDLNAMHEAETVLTDAQWPAYLHGIYRLCPSYREGSYWYENFQSQREVVSATAAQRAEAFLRTILWPRISAERDPFSNHNAHNTTKL